MQANVYLLCPRCPGSTRTHSLCELREHVAKDHLQMTPLFHCFRCKAGFISPQMALHHLRSVCLISQHHMTSTFTNNLLSMNSSQFYELYMVECEAIHNLHSGPVPDPGPVEEEELNEDADDVQRFLGQMKKEVEEREASTVPQPPPKEVEADHCTIGWTIPTASLPEESGPQANTKNCPLPWMTFYTDTGPVPKMQKMELILPPLPPPLPPPPPPVSHPTRLTHKNRIKQQYVHRSIWDHACEYSTCCNVLTTARCNFCRGLHFDQSCGTVMDFEERRMIFRSKGVCLSCGLIHLFEEQICRDCRCRQCLSTSHLSAFCPSEKYQRWLQHLRTQAKYPPTDEILKFRAERNTIYKKEREDAMKKTKVWWTRASKFANLLNEYIDDDA